MKVKSQVSIFKTLEDKYFINDEYELCQIKKQTRHFIHYNCVNNYYPLNYFENYSDLLKIIKTQKELNILNNIPIERIILITEFYNKSTKTINIKKLFDKSELTNKSFIVCTKNSIKVVKFDYLSDDEFKTHCENIDYFKYFFRDIRDLIKSSNQNNSIYFNNLEKYVYNKMILLDCLQLEAILDLIEDLEIDIDMTKYKDEFLRIKNLKIFEEYNVICPICRDKGNYNNISKVISDDECCICMINKVDIKLNCNHSIICLICCDKLKNNNLIFTF